MSTASQLELHEIPAFALLQPLAILIWHLEALEASTESYESPRSTENALASGIILLAASLLESTIRWFEHKRGRDGTVRRPVDILRQSYGAPELADKLEELWALRNALTHGHVWRRRVRYDRDDPKGTLRFGRFRQLDGYGDRSFRRVVDDGTTRHLKLPVIPNQLRCKHAWLFLTTSLEILDHVELAYGASVGMPGEKPYSVVEIAVKKGHETIRFAEIIRQLGESRDRT